MNYSTVSKKLLFSRTIALLLSLYSFNSTPEPRMYLDHEGNRKVDISPSWGQPNTRVHIHTIEAPHTLRSWGVGRMPLSCLPETRRSWAREDHAGPAECEDASLWMHGKPSGIAGASLWTHRETSGIILSLEEDQESSGIALVYVCVWGM